MSFRKKLLSLLLLQMLCVMLAEVSGAVIKVGIAVEISECTFISACSGYELFNTEGKSILKLKEGDAISISVASTELLVKSGGEQFLFKNRIEFRSESSNSFFRFKSTGTAFPYDDELQLLATARGITAVNLVDEEKYVAAVVESEAGNNSNPEFLKVQAILVRTFVESHLDRHSKQGFMVCDKVHCQVYHARSRFNKEIGTAIESTRGKVITDSSGKVLSAAYHSNCGGQTMDSKMLWTTPVAYLQSVQDSFCMKSGHSTWEKTIDRNDWRRYLGKKLDCLIYDDMPDSAFQFSQEIRKNNLIFEGKLLALKTIRADWKLNSTFFNIIPQGDKILILGKGFGHGIGLCQEGAMQMAVEGFKMDDIIKYYFTGAQVRVPQH